MSRATYKLMHQYLKDALDDMRILAGDVVGPSDASWQDVAGTAAVNFQCLASALREARAGNCEWPIVFPSPDDLD